MGFLLEIQENAKSGHRCVVLVTFTPAGRQVAEEAT
jgi:hypothetical protein